MKEQLFSTLKQSVEILQNDMTPQEKIHKILDFCLEENTKGNHLFFNFSGHAASLIEVRASLGGYMDLTPTEELLYQYTDWPEFESFDVDKWIEETKKRLHP